MGDGEERVAKLRQLVQDLKADGHDTQAATISDLADAMEQDVKNSEEG